MNLQTVSVPELAIRPAGLPAPARAVPTRPWDELTDAEKADLMRLVVERHAAGLGSAVAPLARSGVPIPSLLQGTVTQADWDRKSDEDRAAMLLEAQGRADQYNRAEEERRRAQAAGWNFGTQLATSARDIVTEWMRGDTQRQLATITANARTNEAQARSDAERYVANTNLQIAELQTAAARARQTGDTANANQMLQVLQQMMASQNQMRQVAEGGSSSKLSTGAMVGIGVGVAAVVGLGVYLVANRRK